MNSMLLQAIGGTLGAAGSLLLIIGLPTGYRWMHQETPIKLEWWRILGALLVLASTLSLGALSAVLTGHY